MNIDITELLKKQNGTYHICEELSLQDGVYGGENIRFQGPLQLEGDFYKEQNEILFKGRISAKLLLTCSRCLENFSLSTSIDVEEKVVKHKEEQEEEVLLMENKVVDFTNVISNTLSFELPIKKLCKEECKGICSTCGTNLNLSSCLCSKEDVDEFQEEEFIDPRFAKLKNLFKEK